MSMTSASESNLHNLFLRINHDKPLITRSQEDLTASGGDGGEEGERHCVLTGSGGGRLINLQGSEDSLSEKEPEQNGDVMVGNAVVLSLWAQGKPRGMSKGKDKSVRAGRSYSQFEVISEREVEESEKRSRLSPFPDFRDLRRSRDSVLKFRSPSASKPGVSKINMESPELTPKESKLRKGKRKSDKRHTHWVTRYRPGVPVPVDGFRERIMQEELRKNEEKFCTRRRLRIFCGTWNVNGKAPPPNLDHFLLEYEGHGEEEEGGAPVPDIYAIGFQELDLSAQALVGAESSREDLWISTVEQTLSKGRKHASYYKLCCTRLVGIMLLVYINPRLLDSVSDLATESVTTGIGGVLGNKGGVSARFNLFHSSLCFVNCHFAASMEEVEKRNQDYHTIRGKTSFDKIPHYKYSIMEHDMVFWLGDMNYRIQTSPEMTVEVIKAHADNYQISTLLKQDQMVLEMEKGTIFSEFKEGDINFKPSYKYDTNSDNWDSSEKNRPPAWCDRVLFKGKWVELRGYRSHPKMKTSDHKPVSAVFDCDMRVVIPQKERKILDDITRKLDKLENDELPQVDLSATELIFQNVKFQAPQTKKLTVTNTGNSPVLISFIPKPLEDNYCKPWLEAKPCSAFIQPMQDVIIELTVSVDVDTAPGLNTGQDRLEDILVLHLDGGKDFFISVSGNYMVSCFGSTLEMLVRLHAYIREVPVADLVDLSLNTTWDTCTLGPSPSPTPSPAAILSASTPAHIYSMPPHKIPKELYRLVAFLERNALDQENLFLEAGRPVEMQQIRDVLDVGGRDIPGSAHSVAHTLLTFLSALSEPVIPVSLHQKAIDGCNQPMLCKQVLHNMTEVHTRSFLFLISFLKNLLRHSQTNNLDSKLLATIFGDVLLRSPPSERNHKNKRQVSKKKATFVWQFLVNDIAEYNFT